MTKDFYRKTYDTRMVMAGDLAEGKFATYAKKKGLIFAKYGFDRGIPEFYRVKPFITSTPDFIVIGKTVSLVECKGTGRADHVKVKQHDLDQLAKWNEITPVSFFFYDSSLDKYAIMWYNDVIDLSKSSPTDKYEDNDKLYYKLPKKAFYWQGF